MARSYEEFIPVHEKLSNFPKIKNKTRKNLDSSYVIIETPITPFKLVNIDILDVQNKNYALTIGEEVFIPLLLYFQHFGMLLNVHIQYSISLQDICKLLDIKLSYTSVGYSQSNGSLERFHSTLLERSSRKCVWSFRALLL